jgi:hypothetical protein
VIEAIEYVNRGRPRTARVTAHAWARFCRRITTLVRAGHCPEDAEAVGLQAFDTLFLAEAAKAVRKDYSRADRECNRRHGGKGACYLVTPRFAFVVVDGAVVTVTLRGRYKHLNNRKGSVTDTDNDNKSTDDGAAAHADGGQPAEPGL